MSECKEVLSKSDNKPAKKCPDFDSDCRDVIDPLHCWLNPQCPVIDGYCVEWARRLAWSE